MPRQRLKPGEHGSISYAPFEGGRVRARARVRLPDGSEAQVGRVGRTRDEARSAVQAAIIERLGAARGSAELGPRSKVGLACRQWITELRERSTWPDPPVRPQTVDEYERLLGNYVVPGMGDRRLEELTPGTCQAWIDGLVRRGRSGGHSLIATTVQASGVFKQVLDRAVVHDALRDNPMTKVTLPRRRAPVPKAMTALEVYRLRQAVRDWEDYRRGRPGPRPTGSLPAAVDVMLGTGLRIGEVLALHWGDVDLDGRRPTVTVTATLVDINGRGTVRQEYPKTKAGERTIVIPPFTVEALRSIRPSRPIPNLPVFASRPFKARSELPKPQTTANVRTSLRKALDRAGMSGAIHPHLLRATVATVVARGMSVADAAALLGHQINAGVTVRHYIERLTLAPDTSAVLQTLIEVGEAEAHAQDNAKPTAPPAANPQTEEPERDASRAGAGEQWTQMVLDWGA